MDVLFSLENGIYLMASSEVALETIIDVWTLTLPGPRDDPVCLDKKAVSTLVSTPARILRAIPF